MTSLVNKITEKKISRRTFLAATAAGTAGLALAGCGNTLVPVGADLNAAAANQEGTWIPAACWHNCGGRCHNKALVVDGVVIRQKTDDNHPDTLDYPQQRGCPRGRSQRHQCFGADRLKYPMKRKHWEPGGGDKSLRGKDEWVRISWDEALDYVAEEIKRIYADHGPESVLCFTKGQNEIGKLLKLMGGHSTVWDTASFGTYGLNVTKLGLPTVDFSFFVDGCPSINDRLELQKSDTIVLYGMNSAWASPGTPMYYAAQIKKAGAQFIYVGPDYNQTASSLDARWIQVRPGTDTAFMLAVIYVMLTEDDPVTNPLIDWDFLNRYTVGFDASHLPADATTTENLKDYVLGKYDNIPKTPQWAEEICGTPVEDTLYFARAIGKNHKVALLHSYAPARCNGAENFPQLFMTLGAVGGHMGKSGHCCGASYYSHAFNGGPTLVNAGYAGLPDFINPVATSISAPVSWKAILEGEYNYAVHGHSQSLQFQPGVKKKIDIRMMYYEVAADLQTTTNVREGINAHRKVDFVVTNASFLTTPAKYSDIVLPVTTLWERLGSVSALNNREMLQIYSQVTQPLYEAKDDDWICAELAKRLGVDPLKIYPIDQKQQFFNQIAGSTIVHEDGKTSGPLVTITEADIAEWGVTGTPQQGVIGLKEFKEQGVYQVKRRPGDNYGYIAYESYIKDPESNRLPSQSGKFEIYCQWKGDTLNALKYSDTEYKPYPTYIRPLEGYEDTFADWNTKVKGDFPYQVFTPHYLRRSHTVFDNIPQLREAFPNPAFISARDAAEKEVKNGDTILIWSAHGKILRQACLTETLMPGCIALPHGPWPDVDDETGIDSSGCENVLTGSNAQGMGVSGYNTCIVNFEKYAGAPLEPDVLKPLRIINFS